MQLAAYPSENGTLLAEIRDVQLNTTLAVPRTAIASATDLGDLYSQEGAIHPRTKVVNSRRMAHAAAGVLYGTPGAQRGPTYAGSSAVGGAGAGQLCVSVAFEPSTVAGGLVLAAPANLPNDTQRLPAFNIAWPAVLGSDGLWRNASSWELGGGGGQQRQQQHTAPVRWGGSSGRGACGVRLRLWQLASECAVQ